MKKTFFSNCALFAFLFFLSSSSFAGPGQSADGRFADLGNGVISDSKSGLMWAREDSWSHLGKCLNWAEAQDFVKNLKTGGHSDWRLPAMSELADFPKGLVERAKSNNIGVTYKDWNEKYPLMLDAIFGPQAAYWLWSSEPDGQDRAGFVDLRTGATISIDQKTCFALGVRAVRNP